MTAPEVLLRRPYSFQTDVWGLGCFFYTLLFRALPFRSDDDVINLKEELDVRAQPSPIGPLSDDALELAGLMLIKDQDKRITISQILEHPWFDLDLN